MAKLPINYQQSEKETENSCVSKKLTQTFIHSYFKGYKGCTQSEEHNLTLSIKGKKKKRQKSKRFSNTSVSDSTLGLLDMECTCSSSSSSSVSPSKKRKLVKQIFSEDEDSESENDQSNANNSNQKCESTLCTTTVKSSAVQSNSPTAVATIKIPKIKESSDNHFNKFACAKSIRVLDNIVISPPKKTSVNSLEKRTDVKKEEKKINYDTLHVWREFFLHVLKSNHLKHLLSQEHKRILHTLFNVEKDYQYTCIKLFMWKPIWYNIFKYVEKIGLKLSDNTVVDMYNCLKQNDLVETNYINQDLFTLLNLLGLKELREIQRSFKFNFQSNTKDAIIAKLIKNCKTQITLTLSTEDVLRARIKEKLGFCIKLSNTVIKALSSLYILNTFTNFDFIKIQDYFKNLNIVYPPYTVEELQIFGTKEFYKFADTIEMQREFIEAVDKKNIEKVFQICELAFGKLTDLVLNDEETSPFSKDKHLEWFTEKAQYVSILTKGSKLIKSSHFNDVKKWLEYLISQNIYGHKRGVWYCLLSLLYTRHIKNYEAAAKLVISAFQNERDHFTEVQIHELAFRGKVLDKKSYNLPQLYHDQIASLVPPSCEKNWPTAFVDGIAIRSNEPGTKRKYVQQTENGDKIYLTVEQIALEHYQNSGYPQGEHCEGRLICGLFCLLFWDIIYDSYVKGAFISPIQRVPLDMFTSYFYVNREQLIHSRLKDLEVTWSNEELKNFLMDKWNYHSHECSLVPLDSVDSPEYFFKVLECVGRAILAKIFERLVKNYKAFHSGFPDLIVWNYECKKAKFVEVKGENDTLSIKQKLWLNYLMDIGASVEVCHVHSRGSKKKNIKKNKDKEDTD